MDYLEIEKKIIAWLQVKVKEAHAKGLILGLSGGIDSAVVGALAKKAFPDHSLGLIMPCHSLTEDGRDARALAEQVGLDHKEVNLDKVYDALIMATGHDGCARESLACANIKPRLRMTSLYFEGALRNYLVAGTGNKSEFTTGYYTKYGDGGVDIEPLGELLKTDVQKLGRHLGIADPLVDKPPSGGLWLGQTDEGEMGFSYDVLDEYIRSGRAEVGVKKKIQMLQKKNEHKKHMPKMCPLGLNYFVR